MEFEKYSIDGQDIKIVEKIFSKVKDMLTANEQIDYIAVQKKPAVTLLPDSITISNKRIFLCEFTKLGLAIDFEIFGWQDIKDIAFKEEIFGSKVTVIPYTGENLSIDYIPKVQARKLYQYIKGALENYRLEKLKAERETIVMNPEAQPITPKPFENPVNAPSTPAVKPEWNAEPAPQRAPEPQISSAPFVAPKEISKPAEVEEDDEMTIRLKKLKNLFDKQLISTEEYEEKKKEILAKL